MHLGYITTNGDQLTYDKCLLKLSHIHTTYGYYIFLGQVMNVFPINIDITSCNMANPRLRLYTAIKNNLQNAQ